MGLSIVSHSVFISIELKLTLFLKIIMPTLMIWVATTLASSLPELLLQPAYTVLNALIRDRLRLSQTYSTGLRNVRSFAIALGILPLSRLPSLFERLLPLDVSLKSLMLQLLISVLGAQDLSLHFGTGNLLLLDTLLLALFPRHIHEFVLILHHVSVVELLDRQQLTVLYPTVKASRSHTHAMPPEKFAEAEADRFRPVGAH